MHTNFPGNVVFPPLHRWSQPWQVSCAHYAVNCKFGLNLGLVSGPVAPGCLGILEGQSWHVFYKKAPSYSKAQPAQKKTENLKWFQGKVTRMIWSWEQIIRNSFTQLNKSKMGRQLFICRKENWCHRALSHADKGRTWSECFPLKHSSDQNLRNKIFKLETKGTFLPHR